MKQHIVHPFEPIYDKDSKILILGSLPSVKSREDGFYYGHKQNRFYKILAALFDEKVPENIPEKRTLIESHGIALWDVIYECDIEGSSDSSIENAKPTDLSRIFETADIKAVFVNGKAAKKLYDKYTFEKTGKEAIYLPSSSPANAAFSLEKLINEWKIILKYL